MDADEIQDESPSVDADELRTLVAPFEFRASEAGDDGLTLSGYAAVFNSPTRISGHEGDFIESIAPGAFKHTIRNSRPVMQFDHGQHPFWGSFTIATIRKLREDTHGLYVEARMEPGWFTEPLRWAIREQAISGMSFRFSVVKDDWTRQGKDRVRTLKEVRLYELGPVVNPAYLDTSVAIRSLERAIPGITILGSSEARAESSVEEPANDGDPAPSQSTRTKAQRTALAEAMRSIL